MLGLELTDSGFDFSILSEFRQRLVEGQAEEGLFNKLLTLCQEQKWLHSHAKQRTDSTHILARIRAMNRIECVTETMRFALNSLAGIVPDWLVGHLQPDWEKRYSPRADDFHLPKNSQQRLLYAQQVGQDGFWLMSCLEAYEQALFLWQLPGVDLLRRVWLQQFQLVDNQVLWRTEKEGGLPTSSKFISSPYDPQARYSRKNTTTWVGYKVHLSEICEPEQPRVGPSHLITQVTTTVSTDAVLDALPQIHQGLSEKTMLPSQHLVDTGYISAAAMTHSQQTYQVDLVGPARGDYQWRARARVLPPLIFR